FRDDCVSLLWPHPGTVPRLPAVAGPAAVGRPAASANGPVGPGAADAPGSPPEARPVPGDGGGRAGGLAARHPGPQPGRPVPCRRPGPTGRGPGAVAGSRAGGFLLTPASLVGRRPAFAQQGGGRPRRPDAHGRLPGAVAGRPAAGHYPAPPPGVVAHRPGWT